MDITELIDAAARAAVEHDDVRPPVREALAGLKQRSDGLYAVPEGAFAVYFSAEKQRENAAKRAELRASGFNPDEFGGAMTPAQMRESAFRQLNYFILTETQGVSPVAARAQITAAIERGDIH